MIVLIQEDSTDEQEYRHHKLAIAMSITSHDYVINYVHDFSNS